MGRPKHEPTEKTRIEVNTLASVGTSQDEIAKYIGVDRKTLTKHYRDELDRAMIGANAQVARRLFKQTENNTAAAIFWLKCRAGWVDTQKVEMTGANGGDINVTITRRVID